MTRDEEEKAISEFVRTGLVRIVTPAMADDERVKTAKRFHMDRARSKGRHSRIMRHLKEAKVKGD